jgi:phosphoglycerate dehydrogenase-like enzyme
VDHDDLVNVLKERPDLTAVLDVTDPEPPEMSSPLRSLPNVQLSAHISGSINRETRRMSLCMLEEFKRWRAGEALQHEVKAEDFALLA